jgi:hypothetical protein
MARGISGNGGLGRRWWLAGLGVLTAAVVALPLVGIAPAHASSASAPARSDLVSGTPCDVDAKACVALGNQGFNGKAWFIENGHVVRGPLDVSTGGPGEDTPTGTFQVISKDIDHRSTQTTNAEGQPSPMPYSVFFTKSGVAFHGGDGERTAGCVRLDDQDAKYFFDNLGIGDTVQVTDGAADYDQPEDDDNNDDDHHGGHRGGGGLFGF